MCAKIQFIPAANNASKVMDVIPGQAEQAVINMSFSSQARARNVEAGEESQSVPTDNLITQEHSLQLVENLRKVFEEEDCFLHDVVLVSKECGEVKAHRVILAVQSDYFKVNITGVKTV